MVSTLKLNKNDEIGGNGAEHTGECGPVDGEEAHGTQLGDQAQPLNNGWDVSRTAGVLNVAKRYDKIVI